MSSHQNQKTETTAQSGERREEGSNCQADAWTESAFMLSLTQVHAQLEDSIIAVRTYCTLKVHCLQGISGKFYSNPTIILINTHYIKRRQPEFVDLKMIHSCVTYCVHTCKKQSSCLKSCTTQMAPPTYIHTYIQHTQIYSMDQQMCHKDSRMWIKSQISKYELMFSIQN